MLAVIHIDELEKWPVVLGNLRNLFKESLEVEVTIVANGSAVTGYLDQQLDRELALLKEYPVKIEACQNALNAHGIKVEQLPAWVTVVPAGVLRLIELQQISGYAYLKP